MDFILQKQSISKDKKMNFYSFDIFDTLVTRRVATPDGIFTLIQARIKKINYLSTFFCNNFHNIRKSSEEYARKIYFQKNNSSEVTFDEIYNVIQKNYGLTDFQVEELKRIEIATEIKNLVPIEENLSILKTLLAQNKRVVLISDMYYSETQLREILINVDTIFENIPIYVSSENRISKENGKLYKKVKNIENVNSQNWLHCGDNKKADIKKANENGIKTRFYPQLDYLPYERILIGNVQNITLQSYIGSAKLSRATYKGEKKDIYNFGCSFAGPILYSYIDYVISVAEQKGLKNLYFVARDGYIPKIIADIIIDKRSLGIKTHYIYGSRKAWRIPFEDNYNNLINCLLSEYKDRQTVKFLAYRLNLSSKDLAEKLGVKDIDKIFDSKLRSSVSDLLLNDIELKNWIINSNQERKNLLISYLKQEIDFSEKEIAFVDLYGSGMTIDFLSQVINSFVNIKVSSFYIIGNDLKSTEISQKYCYAYTAPSRTFLIEMLSRTSDGQTIGYKKVQNAYEPILEKTAEKIKEWGLEQYILGIENFVKKQEELFKLNDINVNSLEFFNHYLNHMLCNIDKSMAGILGDIPYRDIGVEKRVDCFAPKISVIGPLFNFLLGLNRPEDQAKNYLSCMRSSCITRFIQYQICECRSLRKFLFNVYVHKKDAVAYIRILGVKISIERLLWGS